MIVYFGLDGRLRETVSSYTLRDSGGNEHVSFGRRKGSAGANEILAIFEGGAPTKGALAITYRLPSGEFYEPADLVVDNAYTGYIEFDKTQDLKYLEYEKKYEVVEFDFPKGLFPRGGDGLYLATIRNIEGGAVIRAYGLITFSVEDSAVKRDSSITESQYDYLVSLIESSPLYVRKAGDAMTGPLGIPAGTTEMGGSTEKEIANKAYVDAGLDSKFDKTGGTIGGLVSVQGNMTVSGDVTSSGGSFSSPQIAWNSPDKIPNAKDATEYFVNKKRNNFSSAKETVETLVDFQTAPKSQQEPTVSDDLATKGYVDKAIGSAGGYNVENGSGDGSIQQSGSQAVGSHSAALGLGAYAGSDGEVAVGRYNEKGDAVFAVGAGSSDADRKNAIHVARTGAVTIGRTDKGAGVSAFADNFFFEASGHAVFNVKQATFAGNITASSVTATTFKSVTAENLSTKQYTIGLAKGNTEAIQSYIGLYAEKYDGENYGALVWDSTGTAYVGDASVDENGVVSDPNKQLQPILTREKSDSMDSTPFGLIAWNPFTKTAYNSGKMAQTIPSTTGGNLWSGRQSFGEGGFGLTPVGEENKEILWFSKDMNNKLLMKANGQDVQFQDAKGGVVAYLSDLDGFITKAYADKAYVQIDKDNEFKSGTLSFGLNATLQTEAISGGTVGSVGSGTITLIPSGNEAEGVISFVSNGSSFSMGFTGMAINTTGDFFVGEDFSALNPAWKAVTGLLSPWQFGDLTKGYEAIGFVNAKDFEGRANAPSPSRLTFFSPLGKVSWFDMAGSAQYDYQLPNKSGTIALTSDLSEAGTSVTIRRW